MVSQTKSTEITTRNDFSTRSNLCLIVLCFYNLTVASKTSVLYYCIAINIIEKKNSLLAQFTFFLQLHVLSLKEHLPVTAHVPNVDFLTGCCEFKRHE